MPDQTLDDVRRALLAAPRPGPQVKLGDDDGRLPRLANTSVLLRRDGGSWFTAYFERGRYHDVRTFDGEDAACRDFLTMLELEVPGSDDAG